MCLVRLWLDHLVATQRILVTLRAGVQPVSGVNDGLGPDYFAALRVFEIDSTFYAPRKGHVRST